MGHRLRLGRDRRGRPQGLSDDQRSRVLLYRVARGRGQGRAGQSVMNPNRAKRVLLVLGTVLEEPTAFELSDEYGPARQWDRPELLEEDTARRQTTSLFLAPIIGI